MRKPSLFFAIAVFALACAMMTSASADFLKQAGSAVHTPVVFSAKPVADGKADEYQSPGWNLGKANVRMGVWDEQVWVHAQMSGQGWIAVAFNSKGKGMDGANMVIGSIDSSGQASVRNDLGRGWSHSPAVTQGVLEFAVLFSEGATTLEFSYPVKFEPGYGIGGFTKGKEYSIVVAGNDRGGAISSKHTWSAQGDFIF